MKQLKKLNKFRNQLPPPFSKDIKQIRQLVSGKSERTKRLLLFIMSNQYHLGSCELLPRMTGMER